MSRTFSILFALWISVFAARAGQKTFNGLLAQSELAAKRGDVPQAMASNGEAELVATNSPQLCLLTKSYCDLMHLTGSANLQQTLAEKALSSAQLAEKIDPKSARAHLCVAVSYVKNFPYADNQTKVDWSKAIKTECDTAIALDPKQDIGYYLLARWNYSIANKGFVTKELVKLVYGGFPAASNEEAVKDLKKAIELAPNRIIHHAELAKVYDAMGEKKLAMAELEKCRALKPVDPDDVAAQQEAAKQLAKLRNDSPG